MGNPSPTEAPRSLRILSGLCGDTSPGLRSLAHSEHTMTTWMHKRTNEVAKLPRSSSLKGWNGQVLAGFRKTRNLYFSTRKRKQSNKWLGLLPKVKMDGLAPEPHTGSQNSFGLREPLCASPRAVLWLPVAILTISGPSTQEFRNPVTYCWR